MKWILLACYCAYCGVVYLVLIDAIDGIKARLRRRRARIEAARAEIVRKHGARMLPENRHHL